MILVGTLLLFLNVNDFASLQFIILGKFVVFTEFAVADVKFLTQ